LPVERYGEGSFTFKVPARDVLLASANRLLKFEFPGLRDQRVYERLLKLNVLSTGLSKRTLETLPLPYLEMTYRRLWECFLNNQKPIAPENELLALFLLVEEMCAFNPSEMVREDIQLLGMQEAGPMHSYYYRGPLECRNLMTFLARQHYRTDFLEVLAPPHSEPAELSNPDANASDTNSEASLQLAYLACRRLNRPLPWLELLESLNETELSRYPRLRRLKAVAEILPSHVKIPLPLQPQSLQNAVRQIKAFLDSPELAHTATEAGIPRPIRELVIVEGETEKMLLPLFAATMGFDFNALGVEILPAGGKNNVLSLYGEHSRRLGIPICIVLDSDAEEVARELKPLLRSGDAVFQIAEGEFEDTYDINLILAAINRNYQPYPELTAESFSTLAKESNAQGQVQAMRVVWQSYGLGSFDKIDFAQKYAEAFQLSAKWEKALPPPEIQELLRTIMQIRTGRK
jgi:hypothetical protein